VVQVHREAEGSLLATQLLLAQGALALPATRTGKVALPSARKVLLEIRAEIRNVTGMYLERLLTVVQTRRLQGLPVLDYLYEAPVAHRADLPAPRLLPTN
jgi:hypothetical protein